MSDLETSHKLTDDQKVEIVEQLKLHHSKLHAIYWVQRHHNIDSKHECYRIVVDIMEEFDIKF